MILFTNIFTFINTSYFSSVLIVTKSTNKLIKYNLVLQMSLILPVDKVKMPNQIISKFCMKTGCYHILVLDSNDCTVYIRQLT